MKALKQYFYFIILPAIIYSVLILMNTTFIMLAPYGFIYIFIVIFYAVFHKKIEKSILRTLCYLTFLSYLTFTLSLLISQGKISHMIWLSFQIVNFPYFMFFVFGSLIGNLFPSMISILVVNTIELLICYFVIKPEISRKRIMIIVSTLVLTIGFNCIIYQNTPSQKYKGHGFEYMNGYSSTDLSPYYPYAMNSKLVQLPEASQLTIEKEEDMPILDGAEACYPVYSAIAKAVYKDIDKIEKDNLAQEDINGKIVTFYNSSVGYERLFHGEVDMFFGAKPSQQQLDLAKDIGVELEYTPIGKEGFVFFVSKDNPVNNLSSEDVKKIYHGDITNWKDVGGKNQKIVAFQRPENSGSQAMMKYFMGDVSLKEPLSYEMETGMGGVITEVAEYSNEDGAMGYTFKYFLEGLSQEKNVKILSIDGVLPTSQNIRSQEYPLSTYLYCVTLKSNKKDSVKKLKDFILSPQGQYLIEKTGYIALKENIPYR